MESENDIMYTNLMTMDLVKINRKLMNCRNGEIVKLKKQKIIVAANYSYLPIATTQDAHNSCFTSRLTAPAKAKNLGFRWTFYLDFFLFSKINFGENIYCLYIIIKNMHIIYRFSLFYFFNFLKSN